MPGMNEPFHVYTSDNVFVDGYKTAEEAEYNVQNRNKEAERLGVKARYKVVGQAAES